MPPPASTAIDISGNQQIGTVYWPDGDTSSGGAGQEVQGLRCGDLSSANHIHAHLSIFLNGSQLALPRDVGRAQLSPTDSCLYALHTHDLSGKLHIEPVAPVILTLGQFFAIWGQPLEPSNIAGHTGMPVVIYLTDDGVASRYEGDFAAIELLSHREITIQIGTLIAEIPRYTWFGP
jgi:hypothetical protein